MYVIAVATEEIAHQLSSYPSSIIHTLPHVHVYVDSPAARSSLKCGDELLAVNGLPLHNTTHSEATDILHEVSSTSRLV